MAKFCSPGGNADAAVKPVVLFVGAAAESPKLKIDLRSRRRPCRKLSLHSSNLLVAAAP